MGSPITNRIIDGREYQVIYDSLYPFSDEYTPDMNRYLVRRTNPYCGMVAYYEFSKQLVASGTLDHIKMLINDWLMTAEVSQRDEPEKWEGIEL